MIRVVAYRPRAVGAKVYALSHGCGTEFEFEASDVSKDGVRCPGCQTVLPVSIKQDVAAEAPAPAKEEKKLPHPMQPIVWKDKIVRFRENKAVRMLLDHGQRTGFGLNELAGCAPPRADMSQLAQLIGYSVSGYGDLSYASKRMVRAADEVAAQMVEEKEKT